MFFDEAFWEAIMLEWGAWADVGELGGAEMETAGVEWDDTQETDMEVAGMESKVDEEVVLEVELECVVKLQGARMGVLGSKWEASRGESVVMETGPEWDTESEAGEVEGIVMEAGIEWDSNQDGGGMASWCELLTLCEGWEAEEELEVEDVSEDIAALEAFNKDSVKSAKPEKEERKRINSLLQRGLCQIWKAWKKRGKDFNKD